MTIFNFISMLGGLALFLYGMRIMGDGLKKESSGSFKKALEKVTGNPLMGFLVGAGLTAIIQSATATIVIVSGLVGAGIMTLSQSIGIILGANVGTTITGQIIRLMDVDASGTAWLNFFKPATLAPIAAVIGIAFIMFIKSKKSSSIGTIAMGFGILFTGLLNMTSAVAPLSESEQFLSLFTSFGDRPLLGFLVGFAVAFILQSSSATIGILQALSITGALTFSAVYPIIAGIYLGDCVTTAIVCSIGTKADAKRTGVVNILFNLSEIVLLTLSVNILHGCGLLGNLWGQVLNSGGIANTHTVFNLSCAILLLPLAKTYGKLAVKIVKDDPYKKPMGAEIAALDEALFKSPALALNSSYKALCTMDNTITSNLPKVVALTNYFNREVFNQLEADEDYMDELEDALNAYLAKLSPHLNHGVQEDIQNYYLACVTDYERAGDHIWGIAKCADELQEKGLSFSDSAAAELSTMTAALSKCLEYTSQAFRTQNQESARKVEAFTELMRDLTEKGKNLHIQRMKQGLCDAETGSVYLDILTHMGRVADMCSNIAIHTLVRHNPDIKNYEHQYMADLRHGDNDAYNWQLEALRKEYLEKI